jgi:hypothetical protein
MKQVADGRMLRVYAEPSKVATTVSAARRVVADATRRDWAVMTTT